MLAGLILVATPAAADDEARKVPRFACLKFQETPIYDGPKSSYRPVLTFKRRFLPVEIVREYGTWRLIHDPDGAEGWLEDVKLESRDRYVMVKPPIRVLRAGPEAGAAPVARLEPGVLAKLERCPADQTTACRVSAGGVSGWLDRAAVFGVYATEVFPPP